MPTGNRPAMTDTTTDSTTGTSTGTSTGTRTATGSTAVIPSKQPFGLSAAHIAGTTLAAVTSAIGASTFGVGGTIVGAAFGSIVSTIGGAVYSTSLERAGERLRTTATARMQRPDGSTGSTGSTASTTVPAAVPLAQRDAGAARALADTTPVWRRIRWKPVAILAAVAFALGLVFITVSEAFLQHPIANSSQSGTSVGRLIGSGESVPATDATPAPKPTESSTTSPTPSTGEATPSTTEGTAPLTTTVPATPQPSTTTALPGPGSTTISPAAPTASP
jgi:hypothetical protein